MGGDNSPFKTLKGIEKFQTKYDSVKIIILGDENLIKKTIINKNIIINNYEIFNT